MGVDVLLFSFVWFVSDDVFCSQLRSNSSVNYNELSDSSIDFLESATCRNAEFAKHKPCFLAFRLACRYRKLHLADELWDMLAIQFLLPLYVHKVSFV